MTDIQTFEMLWDCRFCGTKKLLGKRNRHCPNCGAAQDPEWRYFPSEADMVFIEKPKYVGADLMCPACHEPNAADAKFCVSCGADLTGAKEAVGIQSLETDQKGAQGVLDDVVLNKFNAQQAAIKAQSDKQNQRKILGLPAGVFALLAVLLVGAGIFVFLSQSRVQNALTVSDLQWKRTINLESYLPRSVGSWQGNVPFDAYNRSCAQQIKGYNKVPDGQQQVCRQVPVSVACGYIYKDNKDGSGSRQTKYCTEYKQQCTMETRYRDVPYFDTWCNYSVNRWGDDSPLVASGGPNDQVQWPVFTSNNSDTVGAKREKSRVEEYTVTFKDNSTGSYTYQPKTLDSYLSFKLTQRYSVEFNRLGVAFWDTLRRAD